MSVEENVKFNDAFNRLDRVLRDMYRRDDSGKLGITRYLDDMKARSAYGKVHIPGWEQDYRKLRDLRGRRNKMTHETGYSVDCFTEADIRWVQDFHKRVLSRTDPIGQLEAQLDTLRARHRAKNADVHVGKPATGLSGLMWFLFAAALVAVLYFLTR